MTTANVFNLLEQMKGWRAPFYISPFKVNEPFLDDRLEDICRYVDQNIPNAMLRLFSNGSPLTERHVRWVHELRRIDHLWVSLNEVDPDRYRATMKLSFDQTQRRLDELHAKAMLGEFRPRVILSRVTDFTDNTADTFFLQYCRERWPAFTARFIKRDAWIDYTHAADVGDVPLAPCGRWWELNICADGTVALCCMDGRGEYSLGNAHTTPLLDIYNQPQLVSRRQFSASRGGIIPCGRCTY